MQDGSQTLMWTKFKYDVNIEVVFEVALEFANVIVFDAAMDLELRH